jgi:methylmalonyl-CoA/ethylmalonyl-CoA epimerase
MAISNIGPLMQMAFCPPDFDAGLRHWTQTMGVGPFFLLEQVKLENQRFRGAPSDFVFTMALAYWGDMQIELIRPENDAPNMYAEHRGHSLHHSCILTSDIAAARATAIASGATLLVEADVGDDGGVFYADTGGGPGSIIEVLQPASGSDALFAMMRTAAHHWDGSDPVRKLG